MRSVRRQAGRRLREQLRQTWRTSGTRPPWPGTARRAWGKLTAQNMSTWARIVILCAWLAVFTLVSYGPLVPHGGRHLSITAATTSVLVDIWQVQAATVGLVFALAVFVFGLVQGRGRITYREFLARTRALPLATVNVASLLFNGMVLLGLGRQTAGRGWAVTEAAAIALASMATIVVILAGTLRAIDPETEADVQRAYLKYAISLALREDLLQDTALVIVSGDWPQVAFNRIQAQTGEAVTFGGPQQRTVRDVRAWRLALMTWLQERSGLSRPVLHVWPWKTVSSREALLTVDASTSRTGRLWARHAVALHRTGPGRLDSALTALHGGTLEHIRAGRQAEAAAGMRVLGDLLEVAWQAYSACGREYGPYPGQAVGRLGRGPGDILSELLNDLLRSGAVAADPAIQREACGLPRVIAARAVNAKAPGAVRQALGMLEDIYIVLALELSGGGERRLPGTGIAQSRLDAPFGSLMSFVNFYLADAIDHAALGSSGTPSPWRTPDDARFLLDQLRAANETMLRMLRHAVRYRDETTALRALDAWKMPDFPLARNAEETPVAAIGANATGVLGPSRSMRDALEEAETALNSMLLRLFAAVLDAGKPDGNNPAHDPVAEAILDRLPEGHLWEILEPAIKDAHRDWTWQMTDDGIPVSGAVTVRSIDTTGPLIHAFALAVIARPRLVAGTAPSAEIALNHGKSLIAAAGEVIAGSRDWLRQHGCPSPDAASVETQLRDAVLSAEAERKRAILTSHVRTDLQREITALARTVFSEDDVVGVLFTRAGRASAANQGLHPVTMAINAERAIFTGAGDARWAVDSLGRKLGTGLAALFLQYVSLKAADGAVARPVPRDQAASAVREAIADLSQRPGRHSPTAQIAVLAPDLRYPDRTALQIEPADASILRQLGLEPPGLARQVLGIIGGAPVIETSLRDRKITVVDLSRLGDLRRVPADDSGRAVPDFALHEAQDQGNPVGNDTPGLIADPPPGPLQVQISLGKEDTIHGCRFYCYSNFSTCSCMGPGDSWRISRNIRGGSRITGCQSHDHYRGCFIRLHAGLCHQYRPSWY